MSYERLKPENCNKAKCKTCMFGPTPIQISPARMTEIHNYISKFESSHICHTTDKTCYGALELQAKILFALGAIKENSIEAMLKEAQKFI